MELTFSSGGEKSWSVSLWYLRSKRGGLRCFRLRRTLTFSAPVLEGASCAIPLDILDDEATSHMLETTAVFWRRASLAGCMKWKTSPLRCAYLLAFYMPSI
ncbi:unnamed protein product [Pleuronectes platessa]|uniref:Uncharacterized protein n=1 Tax=Pleuronectes platessa TaxID=8262 RepID=A0A9N7UTA7_PLEPL|nr:unnamed protein product [Pleuronectes platessa]